MPDLGKAYVQIVPSAEGISSGISDIVLPEADSAGEEAGRSMGDKLASALKTALIAAGIGAIIKQAVGSVNELADYGDNIDKMSQKMGMSAQAYQEWDAVMQHSGTSMEAMKSSMKTLANAAESNSAAFEELGISQEELASLNQEQLFERTISALQGVEDTTQRTYLAGKTLGRGATELGALLNTSAEDTQRMRDRVHELGGVMSDEAVKDAAAYKDSLQDMQTAISGFGRGIVQEFLPSFTQVMDGVAEIFSGDAGSGVGMILDGIGGIGQKIVEAVPQVIEAGRQIVGGVIQGIAERLPDILTNGMETIKQYAGGMIENLPETITSMGEILNSIIEYILTNLPTILEKGSELITYLANGISQNMPAILNAIGQVLMNLLRTIIAHLPQILSAGVKLIISLVQGMLQIRGSVVSAAGNLAQSALSKLLGFVGQMLSAGVRWITSVISGLVSGAGNLISSAASIASQALNSFLSTNWASVGSNIISGIVSGLWGAAGSLFSSLRNMASNALQAAKSALHIGSPSKLFRDEVGKWIPEGIAVGIDMNADAVDKAVADLANPDAFSLKSYSTVAYDSKADRVDELISLLNRWLPAMAETDVVLDDGVIVGRVNRKLGAMMG